MRKVVGGDVFDFSERGDLGEFLAEWFGSGKSFAVGHETRSHGHHGLTFIAVAIGLDGEVTMAANELPAFFERDRGELLSGGEKVFCFAKDPWILHGRASDHDAGDSGGFFAFFEVSAVGDVAVSDDGDGDGLGALVDDLPVGFSSVSL